MREQLVLRVQNLMFEKFGEGVNDLDDGDAGTGGERVVRRRKVAPAAEEGEKPKGKGKKRKKAPQLVDYLGWSWDPKEKFEIEGLLGKMVTDGNPVPGREGYMPAGRVLYKVLGRIPQMGAAALP